MSKRGKSPNVLSSQGVERYLGQGENRVHVLRGVDVSITRGEMVAVVGPSGCGKSTLLYVLGLLDQPDAGSIRIGDREFSARDERERTMARNESLGFVFQFHFLLSEFTTLENIMLPMRKLGRRSPEEMERRAQELMERVGLADKTHRRANQLSGGEQQRVAVARALANEPDLILADEPTGNLDFKNSERVFGLLRELVEDEGQSVLMVTHNTNLAGRCHRRLHMQDGLIVEED